MLTPVPDLRFCGMIPTEMRFELARPNDIDQITGLLAECDLPYEDITTSHLAHFYLLRDSGRLAGLVGLELFGPFALLRSLAVPAGYRMRGIGSELVERAEEHAHSLKVEALYLLTTTAEGFFLKHGYQQVERGEVPEPVQASAEFRSLCPASAVCMVKPDIQTLRA